MKGKIMKITEAAELVGLSRRHLYRLARAGQIPAYKTGPHTSPWQFRRGEVFNWFIKRFYQKGQRRIQTLPKKTPWAGQSCLDISAAKLFRSPEKTRR